jgi:hypothetical protein
MRPGLGEDDSVQVEGEPGWQIAVDQPQLLLVAMYVRDAAALKPPVEVELPPLDPPVEHVDTQGLDTDAAGAQWAQWWDRALVPDAGFDDFVPPDFPGFDEMPELRIVVAREFPAAVAWAWARTSEYAARAHAREIENEALRDVRLRRGHATAPLSVRITELPVGPGDGWIVGHNHIVVSSVLRSGDEDYRDWLVQMLDILADRSAHRPAG